MKEGRKSGEEKRGEKTCREEILISFFQVNGKLVLDAVPLEPLTINVVDLIQGKRSISGWASGDNRDSEDTFHFSITSGNHSPPSPPSSPLSSSLSLPPSARQALRSVSG